MRRRSRSTADGGFPTGLVPARQNCRSHRPSQLLFEVLSSDPADVKNPIPIGQCDALVGSGRKMGRDQDVSRVESMKVNGLKAGTVATKHG